MNKSNYCCYQIIDECVEISCFLHEHIRYLYDGNTDGLSVYAWQPWTLAHVKPYVPKMIEMPFHTNSHLSFQMSEPFRVSFKGFYFASHICSSLWVKHHHQKLLIWIFPVTLWQQIVTHPSFVITTLRLWNIWWITRMAVWADVIG